MNVLGPADYKSHSVHDGPQISMGQRNKTLHQDSTDSPGVILRLPPASLPSPSFFFLVSPSVHYGCNYIIPCGHRSRVL